MSESPQIKIGNKEHSWLTWQQAKEGMVFLMDERYWASVGSEGLVFFHPEEKLLKTIPYTFAKSHNVKDFIHKCSSMPLGNAARSLLLLETVNLT